MSLKEANKLFNKNKKITNCAQFFLIPTKLNR